MSERRRFAALANRVEYNIITEKERMFTENANRAASDDPLTPDNYEPNPKNPLVAAFFRNIGLADELGSGVRKLFKYGRRYSGKAPQLIDGDVFRAIVPLDDSYSFDAGIGESKKKTPIKTSKPQKEEERALIEVLIVEHVKANPQVTQKEVIETSGKSKRAIQTGFAALQERGILVRQGSRMNGLWIVAKD